MHDPIACPSCDELVPAGTCACPHCGQTGVCRTTARPSRAAMLLGLVLLPVTGCVTAQPAYGVTLTDDDGDGFYAEIDDCNDGDESINPDATETPNDSVDSNCDGEDNT